MFFPLIFAISIEKSHLSDNQSHLSDNTPSGFCRIFAEIKTTKYGQDKTKEYLSYK